MHTNIQIEQHVRSTEMYNVHQNSFFKLLNDVEGCSWPLNHERETGLTICVAGFLKHCFV